jgi:short-subunit dehydrogenase
MGLYRAKPGDGLFWITGASSGIGRGVALEAARRGFRVLATARRQALLDELADEARHFGGIIIPVSCDSSDQQAVEMMLAKVEQDHGPVALAFLNAGTYQPVTAIPFDAAAFHEMFAVNVGGTINGLAAILPRMAARGQGQIAFNASVAGYIGLPRSAAYSGTKAALIAMAESLKFDTDCLGITLQIVNPGFVETPLTAKNDHPMPFLMKLDEASKLICDGFAEGGFEITFPWQLSRILKVLRLLPYKAYFWLVGKATGH